MRTYMYVRKAGIGFSSRARLVRVTFFFSFEVRTTYDYG
jgi:hypothetical protein